MSLRPRVRERSALESTISVCDSTITWLDIRKSFVWLVWISAVCFFRAAKLGSSANHARHGLRSMDGPWRFADAMNSKNRAKKMAAPRSGQVQGGNAQEGRRPRDGNRDTALQQYAEVGTCLQDTKYNHSRQNAAEKLEKTVTTARILTLLLPPSSLVRRSNGEMP
jgi:hypothetical protein